jgi:competence protein ComEC
MRNLVGWMAHWPGSQFGVPPIPLWLLGLYALLACLPVLPVIRQLRRAWIGPAAAMLTGMLLPLWAALLAGPERGSLRLTVLSVGNGSAMLVQFPDGQSAMVDCGAMFNPHLFDGTIQPALRTLGVSKLHAVLLTHEDHDHVSALPEIVKAYRPATFHHLAAGERPISSRARDCQVEVLAPNPASRLSGNDASAVLRIRYAGRSLMFTGDIEDKGLNELLAHAGSLETDVLLAPHHGSAVAATPRLLDATKPHWILCSSAHSRSGRQAAFDRLCQTRGKPPLRTGDTGAITVTIDAKGAMDVRTWR